MDKITARIRKPSTGKGLWLFVDREGDMKNHPDDIINALGISEREEDKPGRVAYAILPQEIKAIRDACNEWLKENKV